MPWHVVVRTNCDAAVPVPNGEPVLDVSFTPDGGTVSNNVLQQIDSVRFSPHPRAFELVLMATGVFQADTRVPRRYSGDRWTRDFILHFPVSDARPWEAAATSLENALSFLTGDLWTLRPYEADPGARFNQPRAGEAPRRVALFSGGMDSFLGAVHLSQDGLPTLLIGHHASSNGTLADQRRAWLGLSRVAPTQFQFLELFLAKRRGVDGRRQRSELTTRSRSIVFLALGILFAASELQPGTLVIPENGFVSLNVPMTHSRLGSLSTRTTHPHFITLLASSLRALGIDVTLELPFRFHTKGMLLLEASEEVRETAKTGTVSCAHPVNQRMTRGPEYKRHCGYCYPCLIRRSALSLVGLDDPGDYRVDVFRDTDPERLATLQAIRVMVHDHARLRLPTLRVLNSGPLPYEPELLAGYVRVWERGIAELSEWLG